MICRLVKNLGKVLSLWLMGERGKGEGESEGEERERERVRRA